VEWADALHYTGDNTTPYYKYKLVCNANNKVLTKVECGVEAVGSGVDVLADVAALKLCEGDNSNYYITDIKSCYKKVDDTECTVRDNCEFDNPFGFNVPDYIDWPDNESKPLVSGVYTRNSQGALDTGNVPMEFCKPNTDGTKCIHDSNLDTVNTTST